MPNTNFQTFHQMGQAINEVVRQATGRDAVQNIDMDHVTVAENHYYHYYEDVTLSAGRVSFTDKVGNTPLEKCVVQIEPVQDLHGYSKPWAGGAGKNKLKPVKDAGQSTTYGGMTVEFNADGSVSVFGTKDAQDGFKRINFGTAHLGAGSYIVTGQNLADPSDKLTLQVMNGNTQIYNMSYSSAQFFSFSLTDEADISINIGFRDGCSLTSPVKMYPMIRLASVTDDTYKPYSNICPITGWTGVNIHVSPTKNAQDGQTYAITFPSEAGTVYGGTLDVTTGTLLVTDGHIASYNGEALPGRWLSDRDVYTEGTVPTTGAQVVYALDNPITYTLTPQEIRTLLGQNKIWADTGNIEVTIKVLKELY